MLPVNFKLLKLIALAMLVLLSEAQKPKKTPVSAQDILSVLSQQPVPVTKQIPQNRQNNVAQPVLNVEPLPPRIVTGADVMTSLQAACQTLQRFISRSEYVKQQMSMMSPSLLPWLYAMKSGFPTQCGYSSYSNALNVFATACNVFETCPLPTPGIDVGTMMPMFDVNVEMPFVPVGGGLGLPNAQNQAMVQSQMLLQPQVPRLLPSVPATQGIASGRKVQRPRTPQNPQSQAKPKRVQAKTKVVPQSTMIVQPARKAVTQMQQPVKVQQPMQAVPIPSMASVYPLWFYQFRQMPTMGKSSGAKSSQVPTTSKPGPEHDSSD